MMPSMCAASALSGSASSGAAREVVGIGQKSVAALLLGENERLAGIELPRWSGKRRGSVHRVRSP